MKISAILIGFFLLVGLIGGAFVIAYTGRADFEQLKSDMDARNDALKARLDQLELGVVDLSEQLEASHLLIQSNSHRIAELSKQISSVRKWREKLAQAPSRTASGDSGSGLSGLLPGGRAVETIKEEVKRELKEERKREQKEQYLKWAKQSREHETKKWRKKMDEEFPKFAQKINLNVTQEAGIRELAEDVFNQVMEMMEQEIAKGEDADWAAFSQNVGKIYEETQAEILELVTEEQANKLKWFFEKKE